MDEDRELLDRWKAGDKVAGQALFERQYEALYRFFDTKCNTGVDDLVQRTFLACVANRDKFRGESTFRTFLFGIARFELYAHYRSQKRAGTQFDPLVSSVAEVVTTPRTRMARDEDQRRVLEGLQKLPLDTQILLENHYILGHSIAELADQYQCPTATIRTRLHRGRKALREILAGTGLDISSEPDPHEGDPPPKDSPILASRGPASDPSSSGPDSGE